MRPISSALLRMRDTVLRETPQLSAIFRSLIPRLNNLRISRYLVIYLTLIKMYLRLTTYEYSIRSIRLNPLEKRWLCAPGMVAPSIPVGWLSFSGQMAQQSPEYSLYPLTLPPTSHNTSPRTPSPSPRSSPSPPDSSSPTAPDGTTKYSDPWSNIQTSLSRTSQKGSTGWTA